jgi:mannose-6-phosphate isomerase
MEKGDSIVISPNEPHAYIYGDIIECMINSDNVVRGGLTPKYKDTDTLVKMLKYEFQNVKPT